MTTELNISASNAGPSVSDHREPAPKPAAPAESEPAHPQASAPKTELPTYGVAFRVDDRTHEVIAVVVDRDTQRVVREIPSEEMRVAGDVIRNLLQVHIDTRA